jgi:tRNA (guanine37-N1)-methyltransferase
LARLREALEKLIPSDKARLMYNSYDIIGDVALVKMPHDLDEYEEKVGEAFHEAHTSLKAVFRVVGETEEIERTRELRLIWSRPVPQSGGKLESADLSRTVYSEYGCMFIVDVKKVFFTPRLSNERIRVARQVRAGEVVACLFGGVCTYAVIMAKVCPHVRRIYSVDINPTAYQLGSENVLINKCAEKVMPILGEARAVCREQLKGACSRVIMPLPTQAILFLDGAVEALQEGSECVINFYSEVSGVDVKEEATEVINETRRNLREHGVKRSETTGWRIVREVGPRRYHIAIDFLVSK